MRLISTNGRTPETTFADAMLAGLAPDGGLFLPVDVPSFSLDELDRWRALDFPSLATALADRWLVGEWPTNVIDRLVREALSFPAPVVPLGSSVDGLELFHGPTLAFKDFGARFLGRFFGHALGERGDHATILVATSGDTGSAVAHGFAGVPGVRVVILYPAGKVSPFQESQMATIGGNVHALRVPGSFDDCQRLVKAAFADVSLAHLRLSSANSINIGRLVPQSFYYVAAYLQAVDRVGAPIEFVVPSGNLGNLTAGVLAARMGLPVARFIAATNANDVLPEYLESGRYRARPSITTVSNAMDVGDPSNFARLERLYGSGVEAMRMEIAGERVSEAETRATIRQTWSNSGYMLDPHGAVAVAAARRRVQQHVPGARTVALLTAHPAKFADVICAETGVDPVLPAHAIDDQSRPNLAIDLQDASYASFRDQLGTLV